MIPEKFVESWREKVKWKSLELVEHDLLLSKVIVDLYADPFIRESIAFRGGTILNKPFSIDSEYFVGTSIMTTYQLEELMATKLRALFQRCKGRDLFDLAHVFSNNLADILLTISIFQEYCKKEGNLITGERFSKNLQEKKSQERFRTDMDILLPEDVAWDFDEAFEFVQNHIITHIP